MTMRFGSVCSGIEAASVAWLPLGWQAQWLSEIEPFPCAVLAHHYPDVPNFGDMTKFKEWPDACSCNAEHDGIKRNGNIRDEPEHIIHSDELLQERFRRSRDSNDKGGTTCEQCGGSTIDVLVGGTPCQSFSVAGLRKGLDDPRGNLMLTYLAIAGRYRPKWLVWENVPGVLSSNGGRDFASLLRGMAELGYGFAYRVLDAQYFGVAQRRRRVFVIGCFGDWRSAAAVLFERHSLSGNPAPRREAGKKTAPTISARTKGGGGLGTDFECDGGLIPSIANPLTARMHKGVNGDPCQTLGSPAVSFRANASFAEHGIDQCGTLNAINNHAVAFMAGNSADSRSIAYTDEATPPLRASPSGTNQVPTVSFTQDKSHDGAAISPTITAFNMDSRSPQSEEQQRVVGAVYATNMQVRRLTPRECERLQGFPDDYTLITARGKLSADGPRYKALGNSMAVPCMRWLGQRIQQVERLTACNAIESKLRSKKT